METFELYADVDDGEWRIENDDWSIQYRVRHELWYGCRVRILRFRLLEESLSPDKKKYAVNL